MIRCLLLVVPTCAVLAAQGKQCGRVQVDKDGLSDRVIGGHLTQKRNWPWLVQITAWQTTWKTRGAQCSGTIVSERWVLTAAHCFEPPYAVVEVSSRIGFLDDRANATVHHKYVFKSKFPGYDVAVVKLSRPIPFSEWNQPRCIANSFRENVGDLGYVVGYGYTSVNRSALIPGNEPARNFTYNKADGELHENLVQFRTIGRCGSSKLLIDDFLRHAERTFCAVGNNRVTAQGDSGGPLMTNRKGVWYQVGTTSIGGLFDDDEGRTKWLSIYSRLSRACDWIEEKTGGDVKCAPMDG